MHRLDIPNFHPRPVIKPETPVETPSIWHMALEKALPYILAITTVSALWMAMWTY